MYDLKVIFYHVYTTMQQLPPSEYIFPDPLEVDPEGEGLICIGADLSPFYPV